MEKYCLNCGKSMEGKNSGAKFCSASCRSSHHQKAKRAAQKPVEKVKRKIRRNVPKLAIWFGLIVVFTAIAPYSFSKCAQLYRNYEIGKQNQELEQLKEQLSKSADRMEAYTALEKKHTAAMHIVQNISRIENFWFNDEEMELFQKTFKKELRTLKISP